MTQTFVTALTLAAAIGMTTGCGASGPEMSSPAGPTSPGSTRPVPAQALR